MSVPPVDVRRFLDLPPCPLEEADAVILPVPLEKTVSYGTGTEGGPQAILNASCHVELFDEQTGIDFAESPKLHTMEPLLPVFDLEDELAVIGTHVAALREKFVLALGGEHTLSFGMVQGLVDDPAELTVVYVDAHADLIDQLDGRRWSHGTVMRRLWERGCRLVGIGVRSLSREEHALATAEDRIETFFAHQLAGRWDELLERLGRLEGAVYLSIDVDGLDPAVIPSTGTPLPGGLSWAQTIAILDAVFGGRACRPLAADLVEFVPSAHPPGCDLTAARLAAKILAFWAKHRH